MEENREISVVIDGRIAMGYSTYDLLIHLSLPVSFVLEKPNFRA